MEKTKRLEKPLKSKTQYPILDVRLLKKVINSARNPKMKMIYLLYLYTGGRTNEVVSLTWADILYKDEVVIRTTKQDRGSKTYRIIPIPEEIQQLIIDVYRGEPKHWSIMSKTGKPSRGENVRREMKKDFGKAGIDFDVLGTTIFRKTFARWMYDKLTEDGNKYALLIVQQCLGHASPETTVRYIGLDREEVNKGYAMLDFYDQLDMKKLKNAR